MRQFWENAQHSKRDTLDVVGLPTSLRYNVLDQKVCDVFQEIGMDICDRDIQAKSSERQKPNNGQIYQQKGLSLNSENKKTIEWSWSCNGGLARENQNIFQWEFVALLSGNMEQMQKVKGQTKSTSILYNKWFNSFTNWGIWSSKNDHPYGWPKEFVPWYWNW